MHKPLICKGNTGHGKIVKRDKAPKKKDKIEIKFSKSVNVS